jgi:alpha-ribazole phosphatase
MTLAAAKSRQSCHTATGGTAIQVVLLRHAQAGLYGHFCGHANPGLSAEGRAQIPTIIQNLSPMAPKAIWSSDLRRGTETAKPIAEHFGLDCLPSAFLREMNFGSWEGLTWEEVELQYPEDARAWVRVFPHHRPPGGESFLELQARAVGQLEEVASKAAEPGCTLVVTHAGFIRATVGWVLGMLDERIPRIGQNHGAITILEKVGTHWIVAALNLHMSPSWTAMRQQTGGKP